MKKVIGIFLLCLVIGVGVAIIAPILMFLFSALVIGGIVILIGIIITYLFKVDWKELSDEINQDSNDRQD